VENLAVGPADGHWVRGARGRLQDARETRGALPNDTAPEKNTRERTVAEHLNKKTKTGSLNGHDGTKRTSHDLEHGDP